MRGTLNISFRVEIKIALASASVVYGRIDWKKILPEHPRLRRPGSKTWAELQACPPWPNKTTWRIFKSMVE
jgi:hypothetical protein